MPIDRTEGRREAEGSRGHTGRQSGEGDVPTAPAARDSPRRRRPPRTDSGAPASLLLRRLGTHPSHRQGSAALRENCRVWL